MYKKRTEFAKNFKDFRMQMNERQKRDENLNLMQYFFFGADVSEPRV